MLPLSLLRTTQGHMMLVEVKSGETYNGQLVSCDTWMNLNLREVICTSRDGERFWRMPECYVRGNTIKYLRIPDEVIDLVQEEAPQKPEKQKKDRRGKGGKGGNKREGKGGKEGGRGRGEGRKGGGRGGDTSLPRL